MSAVETAGAARSIAISAAERKSALILGATSGIGRSVAAQWALQGYDVVLAGRDLEEVSGEASDITIRYGATACAIAFDALDFASHPAVFEQALDNAGGHLDAVVLCHGYMVPQAEAAADVSQARRMIDVNFTSAVSILNLAADYFAKRGRGTIVAVTSVAGDRGRQSNYIYGASKAGLSTYLQGLRHRLARHGVAVVDVRPGFVDTAMTWGLPGVKRAASPQRVAADIFRAARKGRSVVYTPWIWRWIMLIVRWLPQSLFHRTKL